MIYRFDVRKIGINYQFSWYENNKFYRLKSSDNYTKLVKEFLRKYAKLNPTAFLFHKYRIEPVKNTKGKQWQIVWYDSNNRVFFREMLYTSYVEAEKVALKIDFEIKRIGDNEFIDTFYEYGTSAPLSIEAKPTLSWEEKWHEGAKVFANLTVDT